MVFIFYKCNFFFIGLDSYTAQKVVNIMQQLVSNQGKTVICIIHQPSHELLNVFHQLILVADGRIAYSGPPNKVTSFFERYNLYSKITLTCKVAELDAFKCIFKFIQNKQNTFSIIVLYIIVSTKH